MLPDNAILFLVKITSAIPDCLKQRIIWQLYWLLKAQYSHQSARHNADMRRLIRERQEVCIWFWSQLLFAVR